MFVLLVYRVLRLAQLEMRNLPVNPEVASTVEKLPIFTVLTTRLEKLGVGEQRSRKPVQANFEQPARPFASRLPEQNFA